MAKLILLSCLLMIIAGCNNSDSDCKTSPQEKQNSEKPLNANGCPVPVPAPTPIPTPGPGDDGDVPNEALLFDATVNFTNFQREQEDKVYKALEIIKKVVASVEFRTRVLNFTYSGKQSFVDNKGLSNAQIYQVLLNGKEDLMPELDHEMDLDLELYYSFRNTVGYTYPNGLKIWMNTKFFNSYTPTEVAGNIFHEWTHKLGFEHAASYSVSRDASVPYALGYLIEEIGKKYE